MNTYLNTINFLIENEQISVDTKLDVEISCDEKAREEFQCDEPIHIYESYYIGDADENVLSELAKKHNCEDYHELLNVMYRRFEALCKEQYKEIIDVCAHNLCTCYT